MKARVQVNLKPGVLDPQGKAVADTLGRLGFSEVGDVRIGKVIELELEDGLSTEEADSRIKEMCEKLLANTIIENYQIELV